MKVTLIILISIISFNAYTQSEVVTTDVNWPVGLAKSGDYLYIVETVDEKISKLDLTVQSSSPVDVVTGLSTPKFIVINGANLYFSEYYAGTIRKIDISQSNPIPEIVISGLDKPEDLLVVGDNLYYTEFDLGKLSKINILDSNPIPETIAYGLNKPHGLEIYQNELYFAEFYGGKISKIDLNISGSSPVTVINGLDGPLGGMMFNGPELFFFEYFGNKFSKIDVSLSNPVVEIIDYVMSGGDILFDNTDIYTSDFENDLILKYPDILVLGTTNFNQVDLILYPNPSANFIKLKGIEDDLYYTIYDSLGRIIRKDLISKNESIDIRMLNSGHYYFVLESNQVLKFIKI